MKRKQLTLTIGITTCYGEDSILDTVKSIRASKGIGEFRFIIVADRVPINKILKKNLKKYNVELIENKTESGQIKKKKQILDICTSDVIIFTQDDVLFDLYSISKVLKAFATDPKITFASMHNVPVKPTSVVEGVINVGTRITNRIAKYWNGGDNYLSVIGRCEAFRTEFAKRHVRFMDKIVSSDAFFYFENKKNGGVYKYLKNANVYFKNPQNLKEHVRKSSRFQHSYNEMLNYFNKSILDYDIPRVITLRALVEEFLNTPLNFLFYCALFIYTRLSKIESKKSLHSVWETDITTKKVLSSR